MKKMILFSFAILVASVLFAQKAEIFSASNVAIRGYDPVSYFKQGKPMKGKPQFSYTWRNAKWYFISQGNLNEFAKAPEKYAPQYGGYCAYGCSNGYKAPTDPEAWTIVKGRLYLNYSKKVRSEWEKKRDERIAQADKNWVLIRHKEKL